MNTERDSKQRLTDYALSCGYIDKVETGNLSTVLWKEHDVFHVRQHEYGVGRVFWEVYQTRADAYRKLIRAT